MPSSSRAAEHQREEADPLPHFVDFAISESAQEDDGIHTLLSGNEQEENVDSSSRDEQEHQGEQGSTSGIMTDDDNHVATSIQQTNVVNNGPLTGTESDEDGFIHVNPPEQGEAGTNDESEENASDSGNANNNNNNDDEQDASESSNSSNLGNDQADTNETATQNEMVASAIDEFLTKHHAWKAHTDILIKETTSACDNSEPCAEGRPAILKAMIDDDKQVVLHSLLATERNGQVGTVLGYSVGKDRFAVQLEDGTKVGLRAKNLKVMVDSKSANENNTDTKLEFDSKDNDQPLSNERLLKLLFRPGTLFVGTIYIPGFVAFQGRKEYRLIIDSSPIKDELGNVTGILARHCAYEDEQFVWIQVKENNDGEISIRYADGETQCHGTWNDGKAHFEGTVRQLLPTEDGGSIYHAQDEVTHTFTLSPTTALYPNGIAAFLHNNMQPPTMSKDDQQEVQTKVTWQQDLQSPLTESILELRYKRDRLSFELLEQFRLLVGTIRMLDDKRSFVADQDKKKLILSLTTSVEWKSFLIMDSLATERTCAKFRRWAELLDGLSFASVQDRTKILATLYQKGVTRAAAHAESDNRIETGRVVMDAWTSFDELCYVSPDSADLMRLLVSGRRLETNFTRFDGALRRAEERLTDAEICQWLISRNDDIIGDGAVCTICHVELQEDESDVEVKMIRLPCSHCFHDDCLREWLRHHSQCPVCRFELQQ